MKAEAAMGLAALAAVLIVCGCAGDNPNKVTSDALNRTDPAPCEKISDYRMRYDCSSQVAVKLDNVTLCARIDSEEWANECYTTIAAKRRDLTVCDGIKADVARGNCQRKVAGS
jgi:hypothetical protein